ncbi:DNA-directed RNA polymerase III subunit RPC9-like [Amphiura filiformis]|uniref:DNA-directed RNA polymerase III subunit RPC9-like n=1 Tax=Amphiura filiformis TaxID=82378 RepID=UPI003B212605
MEIVAENAAMLSNYEVYSLLSDLQAKSSGRKKPNKSQQNLATISYEAVKYLEKTPCKDQTPEIIGDFMKKLEPFKLTKSEKLQLLNHRPTSAVEIQLMIEESEERLTEDQIEQLIDISRSLPGEDEEEEEQMEADTGEQQEAGE